LLPWWYDEEAAEGVVALEGEAVLNSLFSLVGVGVVASSSLSSGGASPNPSPSPFESGERPIFGVLGLAAPPGLSKSLNPNIVSLVPNGEPPKSKSRLRRGVSKLEVLWLLREKAVVEEEAWGGAVTKEEEEAVEKRAAPSPVTPTPVKRVRAGELKVEEDDGPEVEEEVWVVEEEKSKEGRAGESVEAEAEAEDDAESPLPLVGK
jgi:hypothetical protein